MNHKLPEQQFEVTFVRTQFATATVVAETLEEAQEIAEYMSHAKMNDETEVCLFPDYLQPDWKVDDVAVIRKVNWTRAA
jgi:hypothetical protein